MERPYKIRFSDKSYNIYNCYKIYNVYLGMDSLLTITVRKRDGVVFSGQAKSFSSINEIGAFDILPRHTNFVSVIKDKLRIIRPDNKNTEILITRGIIRVKENEVEVFLGV